MKTGTKSRYDKQGKNSKIIDSNLTILIITVIVNGINSPVKRQNLSDWVKKQERLYAIYKKNILNIKTLIG